MTTFAQTLNPTPFGFFDSDTEFQTEADGMVTFVKRMLGDDVLSVELTKKQIYAALEYAVLEYGSIVNRYQAISQIADFLGTPTGSLEGSEQKYPHPQLEFLSRQAEPYAGQAGVGGSYNQISGSIELQAGVQDYDIYEEMVDADGVKISDQMVTGSRGKMRIAEVFHFSPNAAFRFFDSTSAINYLNNEFSFESFTPETIFYVLPVFEDILRAAQFDVSQRVRRSNYSYKIIGTKIRIYPTPSLVSPPRKLWLRVSLPPDPLNSDITDDSLYGVSNLSTLPFGNIQLAGINSIGRQWIRRYCLALCKELLGRIRSKYQTVPIPNADLVLDGDSLLSQAREDKDTLFTELTDILDQLTYDKIIERDANKAENMQNQLRKVPMPNGWAIFMG